MALNHFDAIVYINLDHRKDRQKLLLGELERLEVPKEKIHRVEAVHDFLNGHRGCAQSHIKALELSQQKKWNNVLILEDDMSFTTTKEEIEEMISSFFCFFKNDWDVFFLAANVFSSQESMHHRIKRVLCAQCAHAYAVNQSYIEILKNCFHESYLAMQEDEVFVDSLFKAIDKRWRVLQAQHRWYIGKVLGQQRRSYSDIEHVIRERYHSDI